MKVEATTAKEPASAFLTDAEAVDEPVAAALRTTLPVLVVGRRGVPERIAPVEDLVVVGAAGAAAAPLHNCAAEKVWQLEEAGGVTW
jgi:hypothetical protein